MYAVDSSYTHANKDSLSFLVNKCGEVPAWWARYLGHKNDPVTIEESELFFLAENQIPLITISRRDKQVVGDRNAGLAAGAVDAAQVNLFRNQYKSSVHRRVFLDVEMLPTLNAAFYHGWSAAIVAAGLEPAIYIPNAVCWPAQWQSLATAIAHGAKCYGTWSSGYFFQGKEDTDTGNVSYFVKEWDRKLAEGPALVKALAWQYIGNAYGKKFDFSIMNPDVEAWWLT